MYEHMKKGGWGRGGERTREEETTNQPEMGSGHRKQWSVMVMAPLDSDLDIDPRVELHVQALILQEPPPHSSPLPMTFLFIFPRSPSLPLGHPNSQRRMFRTPTPHHGLAQPPVCEGYLQPQCVGGWVRSKKEFSCGSPAPSILK